VECAESHPFGAPARRGDAVVDALGGVRRRHHDRVRRRALAHEVLGQDGDDRVLVDDLAVGVDEHDPVAVTVVADAEVGVAVPDERPQVRETLRRRLRLAGREVAVDVGVERPDIAPESNQHLWGCEPRDAVATVHGDGESLEVVTVAARVRDDGIAVRRQRVDVAARAPVVPRRRRR